MPNSGNFVKRERSPDKLIKMKIINSPRGRRDLLRVRWRKNQREKGAIARIPRYSTFIQNPVAKILRKKTPICETKTAAQRPAKASCNSSFLPVSSREREIMKLVAAKVNVSIVNNT